MKPYRKCGIKKVRKKNVALLSDRYTVQASCGAALLWSAPRPVAAPEGIHARGLTIQLSQGQDRQPHMPEGAPPAAGVLRLQAALPLWWVGGIVHVASAGVNPIFHFFRSRAASCATGEQHRTGCWRTSDTVSVRERTRDL
jgi:hypothetical protein